MPGPPRAEPGLAAWVTRWWVGEAGLPGRVADIVTLPAELAFRAAVAARGLAYTSGLARALRAPLPVISIGNLGVGGAGKTPLAAWTAALLVRHEARPAVVVSGYGADEIALHRELTPDAPVFAAKRRFDGVAAAAGAGCGVAVLDDGFQHRALARDLDVVLVSAEQWRGRRRLLPRGPWREGAGALRRADIVVVTAKTGRADADGVAGALRRMELRAPVIVCELRPTRLRGLAPHAAELPLTALRGREVLAVAALADPHSFAANLDRAGARAELASFRDHHPFDATEASALVARAAGRPLVMTRKDAVKLRALIPADAEAWVLEQDVVFEPEAEALLTARSLAAARRGPNR